MLRTIHGLTLAALLTVSASAFGADVLYVSDHQQDPNITTVLQGDGHVVTVAENATANGYGAMLGPLSSYGAVVWYTNWDTANPAVYPNLASFVSAGGRVFISGYDNIRMRADLRALAGVGSARDYGWPGGAVIGVANSLTTGVVDIRGVVPGDPGEWEDWDTVSSLGPDTVGVVPSLGSPGEWHWTLRTLGLGEVAYVSNSNNWYDPPYARWLDTTPPPSGLGAFNAALRNFVAAAGAGILPPPPDAVLGCVRLRDLRLPPPGGSTLTLRADVDFGDWSLDLGAPATLEYGTRVVDLPDGFTPNRRRTMWTFRQGDLRVAIRTPRNDSSKGSLMLIDRGYEEPLGPRDDDPAGEPFHFGFSCAVQDVAADVWLDVDRVYRMGKTPAVMEPLTVRQFKATLHRGLARRFMVEAEFAGTNEVPVAPPMVILRVGEPGNVFQIRLPNDDYVARRVAQGWIYGIDRASGLHPYRGLWYVFVDYTDRSVTAHGSSVDIGAFPLRQAPVYVSLAVDGPENAVEILADVRGRNRLNY